MRNHTGEKPFQVFVSSWNKFSSYFLSFIRRNTFKILLNFFCKNWIFYILANKIHVLQNLAVKFAFCNFVWKICIQIFLFLSKFCNIPPVIFWNKPILSLRKRKSWLNFVLGFSVHDLPQEVHPWVRAFASYAHSRRGTLQVQVLPQVIRQVGPLPDSYIRSDLFGKPVPSGKERVELFGNKAIRESYKSFERHLYLYFGKSHCQIRPF